MSMPETARASSLMSPTLRTPSSPPRRPRAAAHGELLARIGQIALELLALVQQGRDARGHILKRHFKF